MFRLVTGNLDEIDFTLADRIYRFRHTFFVEGLGWESCRRTDGRERDRFDGPTAFHFLGEENDEIVAYARFLPTTGPHLLSHLYPQIMQGGSAPKGPAIYEWTRQAIVANRREMPDADLFAAAVSGAIALVVHALNLDGLLIEFHPAHIPRLLDTGWYVRPLALPTSYEGSKIVPVYAQVTGRTLKAARAAFAAWPGARLRLPLGVGTQHEVTIQ
jgi:acyl-homoserine lactone synthase